MGWAIWALGWALAAPPTVGQGEQARIEALLAEGRAEQALLAARRLVELRSLSASPDDPSLVPLLHLLGEAAEAAGQLDLAVEAIGRAVTVEQAATGVSVELAADLGMLGSLHYGRGDWAQAQDALARAVAVAEQALPTPNPYATLLRRELARVRVAAGDAPLAMRGLQQVLEELVVLEGQDSPALLEPLVALGRLERDGGDLAGSRRTLERALGVAARSVGAGDATLPVVLDELSTTLLALEETADARAVWKVGLEATRTAVRPSPSVEGTVRRGYGEVLTRLGELDSARAQLDRARALHEASLGPRDPEVAADLLALGRLQRLQGDPRGARRSLERALTLREQAPLVDQAEALVALAEVLVATGDRAGARARLARRRLAWEEVYGTLHPAVLDLLAAEARELADAGELGLARERYGELLMRRELTGGPYDAEVPRVLTELGWVFLAQREQPRARKVLERAWRLAPEGVERARLLARARATDGDLADAVSLVDGVLDAADPVQELALRGDRARWLARLGDEETEAAAAQLVVAARRSGLLDEPAGWQALLDAAAAGQATALDALPQVVRNDATAAAVLRRPVESERLQAAGLAQHALDRWVSAHWDAAPIDARLSMVLWSRALAAQALASDTDLPDVHDPTLLCGGLAPDESWVVYARLGTEDVAFAVRGGQCETWLATRLRDVQAPLDALRRQGSDWDRWSEREAGHGTALRERIWDPLRAMVEGAALVYVTADPELADLPLAGLPTGDDRYLVEDHAFSWLARPADLLHAPVSARRKGRALVVGSVDTRRAVPQAPDRPHQAAPCAQALAQPPLPAAGPALRVLQRRLGRRNVDGLGGVAAGEAVVEARSEGLRWLHLAAVLPASSTRCVDRLGQVAREGLDERSLGWHSWWRTGLQLAGAGAPQDPAGVQPDGIWTPAEVARLDGSTLDWVAMTRGEDTGGEAAHAMRSAWGRAGVRTVLLNGWRVPERAQSDLLVALVRSALKGRPPRPAESLAAAQRAVLEAARRTEGNGHPGWWASWSVGMGR